MEKRYVKLGIIFAICSLFVFSYPSREQTNKGNDITELEKIPKDEEDAILVSVSMDNEVVSVDLDTYLLGVVAGEMPASFELEALKAQVVASRTFVFRRGLEVDNTTTTQVYLSDEQMRENWQEEYEEKKNKINQAIAETSGEVLMYQGEYISALFFSSSNGYTENNSDYFMGAPVPYLQSVESPWDANINPRNTREKSFSMAELKQIFEVDEVEFHIISYKESGRIDTIKVNDKEYTGREVRELLSLSSSDFKISLDGDTYTFISTGNGHGVGMSQYGAQGMALEGHNYREILQHYYTDVEIVNN
jgi:stage II sporulation protein D